MTTGEVWVQRHTQAVMNTFGPPKVALERGSGAEVWDADGNRYLDLYAGIAVNALGHAHPRLVAAVADQLATLGHVSNFFATAPQVELAERLVAMVCGGDPFAGAPAGAGKVFLTNSGTEANEAALKLTRRTGRSEVVAAEGGFHGRSMGALSITAKAAYREPFEPLPGGVRFVPYGDPDALASVVTERTAAVVLEPVQGEAGVVVPSRDYLLAAREITEKAGALLWLDEVQTGIGRTGTWLAHHNPALVADQVRPDVVTFAKGLGGGLPIGACVAVGAAAELLRPGHHGSTFGGNPVAAAAALAVMDVIAQDDLIRHGAAVGERLRGRLATADGVSAVRGAGAFTGIDLSREVAADFVAAAQRAGFLVNNTGPATLRLAPPLVLTDEQAEEFLAAWPALIAEVGGPTDTGTELASQGASEGEQS